MRNRLIALLILLLTVSCKTLNHNLTYEELMQQRSEAAKSLEEQAFLENCELNTKKEIGKFKLNNNLWGKPKLKGKHAELCTFQQGNNVGWKWQVSNRARGVIGYPAIQIGPGPWHVKEQSQGFPIRLDDIESLYVNYATEMYIKHKKYNLAFDLWLSSEFNSTEETVTTEIMIWEDWFDFSSYGKIVDTIKTPFGNYDVYTGYLKNDDFGQDWNYFAFVRKEKRRVGEVDIKFLLDYLIEKQGVNPQEYLTSVEFGNEIGNSSGFTLVKEFDVHLN